MGWSTGPVAERSIGRRSRAAMRPRSSVTCTRWRSCWAAPRAGALSSRGSAACSSGSWSLTRGSSRSLSGGSTCPSCWAIRWAVLNGYAGASTQRAFA
eukprot:677592-Pyramimonas_sp.AAC.1